MPSKFPAASHAASPQTGSREPDVASIETFETTPEIALDCLTCGACCRTGADGRILIPEEDLVRWRASGRDDIAQAIQPGHFGLDAFATHPDGSCVHLGTSTEPNGCRIYEVRGTTCREFERGSRQCLEFRRDFHITA